MIVLALFGAFAFVYLTNVGQLVHGTPTPNWLEGLGR